MVLFEIAACGHHSALTGNRYFIHGLKRSTNLKVIIAFSSHAFHVCRCIIIRSVCMQDRYITREFHAPSYAKRTNSCRFFPVSGRLSIKLLFICINAKYEKKSIRFCPVAVTTTNDDTFSQVLHILHFKQLALFE